jgi:protein involved in polysaccharide export with SLBB domain
MNLKFRWIAVFAMISTIVPAFSQIKAGQVKFTQGLTLDQAIRAAGGPTEFASMRRVRVYRDGKAHQHDLTKVENMQVKLNQGDTIVVPQKDWFSH